MSAILNYNSARLPHPAHEASEQQPSCWRASSWA